MQEHRLPKVIHHQETNKNSHILGFKNRQRKALIYKKYDWIQNASGERNLSHLQQIINISLNNLNTIKKKRNLFTQI